MYINLLPNSFVAQQVLRRQVRAWSVVVLIAIICGGAFYAKNLSRVVMLRQHVENESLKHPGLRQMAAEVGQWEQKLLDAQVMTNAIDQLRTDKRTLTLVGLVARSASNAGGKTRLQHLSIRLPAARATEPNANGNQLPSNGAASPTDFQRGSLTMDGLADSADTISKFVAMLRETGILSQVNLKGSTEYSGGSERCRQFQIECDF